MHVLRGKPRSGVGRLHDKGGDHAEHALVGFDVVEDVAVPYPGGDPVGVEQQKIV